MGCDIQSIDEQIFDKPATKLSRRQGDAMQDNQLD